MRAIFWVLVVSLAGSVLYELFQQSRAPSVASIAPIGQLDMVAQRKQDTRSVEHRKGDEQAAQAAQDAANLAVKKALAAGKSVDEAWEEAAVAAARAASDVELAAGRPEQAAREAAQQVLKQIRAQATRARAVDPSTLTVEMSFSADSANPPVISGSTNLPDGTQLTMLLTGQLPACAPRCGWEYDISTVQGGRFTARPKGSTPLMPGSYTIDVATPMASIQPENVRRIIGENGEQLRGPYVVTLEGGKYVPVTFPRGPRSSEGERFVGLMIRYTEKIRVSGAPVAQASSGTQREERWQRLEADNGLVFGVSLSSISRSNIGSATIVICSVQNDRCQLGSMRRFLFDCRGQYRDITDSASSVMLVPPRSVVGAISKIACSDS